jgi:hypothetical protein
MGEGKGQSQAIPLYPSEKIQPLSSPRETNFVLARLFFPLPDENSSSFSDILLKKIK